MAELITGLQGSGKSYYAMHRIYNDKEKYDKVMTDIDGLTSFENIYALDFPSFVQKAIKPCYELMVKDINAMEDIEDLTAEEIFSLITTNDSSFQDAIEYLQRIYVLSPNADEDNRLLLIVDEAQNYFGKTVKLNAFLLWFITQHRHLYMEIYLITQDHSLIRPDYKLFNIIYRALPPAKQVVRGTIIYNQYCGFPLNNDNFVKKLMLKKDSKIFDLYVSGDKVESPNIFRRYIIMLVIMLSIIGYGIYYFINDFVPSKSEKKPIQKKELITPTTQGKTKNTNNQKEVIYEDVTDKKLYTFVVFEDRFYVQGLAGDDYPLKLLLYIKKHYFQTVIEKIKRDSFHTVIYVICDKSLENIFQKKLEDKTFNKGVENMTYLN